MRRLFTNWRVLGIVLVIGLIVATALWPEVLEIDVARVDQGPLQVTIDEEAQTRVRERFVISAPVAGRLGRIDLDPGDRVARGHVVARLTPSAPALLDSRTLAELRAAVESAHAAVGQARAERDRAGAALARAQGQRRRREELFAAGGITRDDLEAAQAEAATAEEMLKAADFSVNRAVFDEQLARARLQPATQSDTSRVISIGSPIDGVVLKRVRESETVVQAGEPLLEVGDAGALEIVADLLSTDAVRVVPGTRVLIEQWGGLGVLEGRVRRVEPSGFMKVSALGVEEQRVNVTIDFVNPEAGRALGDGYRVEVRIVVWERPDVVRVPTGALFRQGNDWAVFAVEDGVARQRLITIGQRNATHAEIQNGLTVGEAVVLHPPDTLSNETRVVERPNS